MNELSGAEWNGGLMAKGIEIAQVLCHFSLPSVRFVHRSPTAKESVFKGAEGLTFRV